MLKNTDDDFDLFVCNLKIEMVMAYSMSLHGIFRYYIKNYHRRRYLSCTEVKILILWVFTNQTFWLWFFSYQTKNTLTCWGLSSNLMPSFRTRIQGLWVIISKIFCLLDSLSMSSSTFILSLFLTSNFAPWLQSIFVF